MSASRTWSAALRHAATPASAARELLARPVEELLAIGGDDRQVPRGSVNAYGYPLADLDPVVRGSSCTASPPDGLALGDARAFVTRVQRELDHTGALPSPDTLRARVVGPLLERYGLPERAADRVVLTASGTDAESLVTALTLAGTDRLLRNVVVGAVEAGSGTFLAAGGRHSSTRAPMRDEVERGAPIAGFGTERVGLVDVELRDARGRARRAFDVEAEVEAFVEHAIECGERVLVHAMAGSKTGLRQLDPSWIRLWRERHPDDVRVVVDAAQARCSAAEVRAFLRAGASVSLTGSKAMGAPPFCGVLLLDDAFAADAHAALDTGATLPEGLRDFVSAADLPPALRPLLPDAEPANLGLLARWAVALAELERLRSIPAADRELFAERLYPAIFDGLARLPRVQPIEGPDATIMSFGLRDATGELHDRAALAEAYAVLVRNPGVQLGQPVQFGTGGAAVLRYAIGATTVSRPLLDDPDPVRAAERTAAIVVATLGELLPDLVLA
ncbi:MAG TPA: hypothetical protein VFZ83_02130 [Acidimicrobiia bacterium]|nr:hypothetical protein [Acidimicrobiia bacterium]